LIKKAVLQKKLQYCQTIWYEKTNNEHATIISYKPLPIIETNLNKKKQN